ncbi:precorrin-3B synthase [Planomonospora sp. ID67723]|uniref:precorrin-3B synthase n=1 Tax=Planomonospora sp. ID67723 TaxID=2738134 RepID=UPI0018C435EB|nr:precorrin-3B synthase [Planomonospora sp. ID67723]MBG0833152.1 precorrin-3B synthase [Planomonospora sp. ID67723]
MVNVDLSGRTRLDACPGALQVHAAADGGLARVRVPGGRLTAAQLRELARAAAGHGTGVIELTSRANVQVRGLRTGTGTGGVPEDGERLPEPDARIPSGFAARMARAGLLPSPTHERVRNILASPLTGCDGAGTVDVGPLVSELDRLLCARPALAALSGRFLFALDDGRGDVAGLGADAGILPVGADGTGLVVAGADSGLRVPLDAAVPALLAVAEAFLAELAELADSADREVTAWRIKELPDGPARVTARVRAALSARVREPVRLRPAVAGPLGVLPGRDGRVALGVGAPLGRLTSAQAELLADLAGSASPDGARSGGEVRLTPWRGVVLPGLAGHEAGAAITRLADAGLVTGPGSPWAGVSACTGRPGCAKSLADVQADAALAVAATAGSGSGHGGGTLPVHWAGCERRCGRPRGRVVEAVATGDGYRVELGGQSLACADIEQTAAAVAAARGEK